MIEDYRLEKELKEKSGIYVWTSPAGKEYVGEAKKLGSRHKDFRCATINRPYAGANSVIDKARQKYPYDQWTYKVLEYCPIEMLGEREQYWIEKRNTIAPNGYNITKGGAGGCGIPKSAFKKGRKATEEEKRKKRETLKKHLEKGIISYEYRMTPVALYSLEGSLLRTFASITELRKTLNSNIHVKEHIKHGSRFLGKYMVRYATEDTPLFIEPYQKPKRTMSVEAKEKMRAAKLGTEYPKRWVPVVAVDDEGNIAYKFSSVKDAANFIHPDNIKAAQKNITQVINKRAYRNGVKKKCYGYHWEKVSITQ